MSAMCACVVVNAVTGRGIGGAIDNLVLAGIAFLLAIRAFGLHPMMQEREEHYDKADDGQTSERRFGNRL